jgi:hypothetical protein
VNYVKTFLASPANRSGLAIWLGTAIVALCQYFVFHNTPSSADLLGLLVGFIRIIEPDASVSVGELAKTISDVQSVIATKSPASIAAVVGDGEKLVDGVTKPAS